MLYENACTLKYFFKNPNNFNVNFFVYSLPPFKNEFEWMKCCTLHFMMTKTVAIQKCFNEMLYFILYNDRNSCETKMLLKNFNVNFFVSSIPPFKKCMIIIFNKFLRIRSDQGYTYDMQVKIKFCYISMWEVENGQLIQKTSMQYCMFNNNLVKQNN